MRHHPAPAYIRLAAVQGGKNFYEWQSFTDEDVEEIPETAEKSKNIDDLLGNNGKSKVFEVLKGKTSSH